MIEIRMRILPFGLQVIVHCERASVGGSADSVNWNRIRNPVLKRLQVSGLGETLGDVMTNPDDHAGPVTLSVTALAGVPEIRAGDDLAVILIGVVRAAGVRLAATDIVVVAQKIVSKAEGRFAELSNAVPSARALELAAVCGKDPRFVELVLGEASEVVRCAKDVLIVRHRLGFVVANAGIDQSNIGHAGQVLLLPEHPDASAEVLRGRFTEAFGAAPAVIISDSFGRPWRQGVTGVALGCAGIGALWDRRGELDRHGRPLLVTQVAIGDAVAAAAALVIGEAAEGRPVAIVRGVPAAAFAAPCPAAELVRPAATDLFR